MGTLCGASARDGMPDLVGRTLVEEGRTPRDPENGVYIVIDNERTAPEERYRRRAIRHMAVIHLFLGSLAVTIDCLSILNILGHQVKGVGLCCGLVFTATGTLGLTSLQRTSTCKITTFMVLSIISAVFGGFLCLLSLFEFMIRHGQGLSWVGAGILALVGLIELVVGTLSSAYACLACCSCCGGEQTGSGGNRVVYLASPGAEEGAKVVRMASENPQTADGNDEGKYARFK